MNTSDLIIEIKALQQYASEVRSVFWISRCETLLGSMDQIEAAADCLFFASLKNALVIHENVLWIKGLIEKPDFRLPYEYKSLCIKALLELIRDDSNSSCLKEIYRSKEYGSYQKFDLMYIFSLAPDNSRYADLVLAVDAEEITEMLCNIEVQIGETFQGLIEDRTFARDQALQFAKQFCWWFNNG